MALFRRLFYRKPPDRLLEIADRVYVFDCCFSTEIMDQLEYRDYLDSIVLQLGEQFADSALMVLNFRDEGKSVVSGLFSLYSITAKDYPCQYLGCPLLPFDIVIHFLRLSERWLMLEGQQNILLMHCEKGGWPVLAFMLAGLLLYRKQYNGEQRTLEMVYKQTSKELLQTLTPLNPQPSHIRYLQYIRSLDDELGWPRQPIPFTLDCIILRELPNFDGVGGCRPIVRVHCQDLLAADKTPPPFKSNKHVTHYRQADSVPVKLNVGSFVQGDVVLECLHVDDGLEKEKLMFRVVFNTLFIQSHILMLNFEDIDVSWDVGHRFTKNFKAEVLFSDFDAESDASTEIASDDNDNEVGSADEFFEAEDNLSALESPRKAPQFPEFDGTKENKIDDMSSSFEIPNEEISCTSTDANTMLDNITNVMNSSLEGRTDGCSDKDDVRTIQNSNTKQEKWMDSNQDLSQTDNVLVKEVIISEINSPKDVQMIKEVIISEVTTSKPVPERDTVEIVLGDLVHSHNSKSIALAEAEVDNKQPDASNGSLLPPYSREDSANPPSPPPPPPVRRECLAAPSPPVLPHRPSLPRKQAAPPPPPPPPSTRDARPQAPPPPPPPPPTTGVCGLTPSPPLPPPGTYGGAPPPSPLPEKNGGVPPPPPPIGALGGLPCRPPPAGFRGGAPSPPPPPGGYGGPPPPPPPRGHGGAGASPPPPGAPAPPMPPGVRGGPPPPPGGRGFPAPPGGRGHGLTRSLALGPSTTVRKASLKPLHWVKVTRAMQGTLWAELQKQADDYRTQFDVNELESLFTVLPKPKGGPKSEAAKALGSKPDKIHLIDIRRANNTEIMLTKIKMPLPDMMRAALALDDSVLDADQVENLIKFCPTKEEMELLKNYNGNKENLGKCEQFFLELMKVPRVESKFRIFSFKIQFQSQVRDLRKNFLTVASACEELRGSEKLKAIMKNILLIGNTLNEGTPRGQAVGFRLDSMLKLIDTRATSGRTTLMHFLCKSLAEKSPELLNFYEDFVSLEAASKMQLKALAEEQQAVVKGLATVEQELSASKSDGPVSNVFRKNLKEFLDASGADVRSLSALYLEVGRSADALCLYFGEDPAKYPFEQVASTLLTFVGLFRKSHEENLKQIEAEKKKAQKEAEKEASQARTPKQSKDGQVNT